MQLINSKSSGWILLFVAFIWGSGFIATHIALNTGLSPYFITAIRFSIATVLFYGICWRRLDKLLPLLLPGFILGLFLSLAFIFQTVGLKYTTPSKNAFITATNVIFTLLFTALAKKQSLELKLVLAVLLVITGIGLLTLDNISGFNLGDFLTLICAGLFALHIYFIGYFVRDKGLDLHKIVFLQFCFATLISIGSTFIFGGFAIPGKSGLIMLLYQGIINTLLAFFLQNSSQRYVSQSKAALLLSAEAGFGTLLSVLIVKEVLTMVMLGGFLLMFLGIVLAETGNRDSVKPG